MAPMSFSDFPEDLQLNILSFLRPIVISRFACTCRRFAALCSHSSPSSDLWFAICDRRWGSKTQLRRWPATPSPRLYRTLDRWEHLIGFWWCIASRIPPITEFLVFFEWSYSCIIGYRITPSPIAASYSVCKIPFLWLGVSAAGETLSYLHSVNPLSDSDVIPVTISIIPNFFKVEYDMDDCHDSEELHGLEAGSRPDGVLSEIYQYFANRTSPGAEKSSRRQRKKRLGRRRWDFLIIADTPNRTRRLEGLWKGITENMILQFYVVKQGNDGEITCWLIDDPTEKFFGYSPVIHFQTYNTIVLESPFPIEEHAIYSTRKHIGSAGSFHCNHCNIDWEIVSRILCINCCYDEELPDLVGSSGDPINDEGKGRIWEYEDGTFGLGLLRNDFIIDMKHIALDGYILDVVESSH